MLQPLKFKNNKFQFLYTFYKLKYNIRIEQFIRSFLILIKLQQIIIHQTIKTHSIRHFHLAGSL